MDALSEPKKVHEITCQYLETFRVGLVVSFKNSNGTYTKGYVTGCDHYSDPENGFTSTLKVVEV